jgi:hypothetical protein
MVDIPLIALLFAAMCSGQASDRSESRHSYACNEYQNVIIADRALLKAPKWLARDSNPPLAARKAIDLANTLKATLVSDTDGYRWKLQTASLIPCQEDRWIWFVSYMAFPPGGGTGTLPELKLVVLMDGTAMQAVIEDRR